MKSIVIQIISLILCVSIGTASIIAQQNNFSIVGQAIDEHGKPLDNIVLTLHYVCRSCTDSVNPVIFAQSDGTFGFPVTGYSKGLELYIEERYPDTSWLPFHGPPFYGYSHLRLFKGISIPRPKAGKNLELGRVVVRLRYAVAKLDLESLFGGQYEPKYSDALSITLRNSVLRIVQTSTVPPAAFDSTLTSANLALPPGKWLANLFLGQGPHRINSPQVIIDIDKDLNVRVSLKPSTKVKPARKTS